jgi:hypothetical protein
MLGKQKCVGLTTKGEDFDSSLEEHHIVGLAPHEMNSTKRNLPCPKERTNYVAKEEALDHRIH